MDIIIQHFKEKITSEIKKELDKVFLEGQGNITELIDLVDNNLKDLGKEIIRYVLEESDKEIKKSSERKKSWVVQGKDNEKTLITEFGEVKYKRTYYKSKGQKGFTYLVDDYFGIERYRRMDKGLEAKIIDLSRDHSYQKSADLAVKEVKLSRQTVKNKIRKLGEVDNLKAGIEKATGEKKKVKRLYIEADEDHISLQDGSNTIARLVYIHEGIKRRGNRVKLKNAHYFSGRYKDVEELWLEVADYIYARYDTEEIKCMYLAGDGAEWIKQGLNWLPRTKYVLDRYHLNKYVLKATGHMPSIRHKLWDGLNRCNLDKVEKVFEKIIKNTERDTKIKAVKDARKYILDNWGGIEIYKKDPYALGCSAEGHVSHVLSDRMSSRPLGWSTIGAEQMSRLRAFKYNNGDREAIYKLLTKEKNNKALRIKTEKIIKRKSSKRLYPEAKETIPALKQGKVDGLFRAVKSLAY